MMLCAPVKRLLLFTLVSAALGGASALAAGAGGDSSASPAISYVWDGDWLRPTLQHAHEGDGGFAFVLFDGIVYAPGGYFGWYYNHSGAPSNLTESAALAAIQNAAKKWTAVCGINITYLGTTAELPRDQKTTEKPAIRNIVGWRPASTYDVSSYGVETWAGVAPAYTTGEWNVAYKGAKGGADIAFNSSTLDLYGGSSGASNLEAVAAHEFGHAIGIAHSDVSESIMFNKPYHDLEYDKTLRADDIAACASMYGYAVQPDFTSKVDGLAVTLDASKSALNGNTVSSYQWSSSGGQFASGKTATLTFAYGGTYEITLTITTDKGTTYKKTATVVSTGSSITADFSARESTNGSVSLDVTGTSSYGPTRTIASYQWASSDGQTASGKQATLSFAKPGTYSITLTITDDLGMTSKTTKTITVVTGSSGTQTTTGAAPTTIKVGSGPTSIIINGDGNRLYVLNDLSSDISVISLPENKVTATVPLPVKSFHAGLRLNLDGSRIYVLNAGDASISLIDVATFGVKNVSIGTPILGAMTLSGDGKYLFMPTKDGGQYAAMDTASLTVSVMPSTEAYGKFGNFWAVNPGPVRIMAGTGYRIYHLGADKAVYVDDEKGTNIAKIAVAGRPQGMTGSADGSRVYVSLMDSNTVVAIDTASNKITNSFPTGSGPSPHIS